MTKILLWRNITFRIRMALAFGLLAWLAMLAPTPVYAAPNTPSGLTVVLVNSNRIDLTWADNSTNETGFHIETSTDAAFTTGTLTFTVNANTTTYTNTTVYPGDTFYYRVKAFDSTDDSDPSNVASVYIPTGGVPPLRQQHRLAQRPHWPPLR